jgi:hypothetical protein
MEGEVGVLNGMADDSNVRVDNENAGVAMTEEAAEGAAGLNTNSGDGVDGEEPTGEVRQERVVVSKMQIGQLFWELWWYYVFREL